jgi:hypothetical protein
MSCEKERIRVIKRKTKAKDRITTTKYHDKLFFAEQARRPIRRGNVLIITDIKLPITSYDEEDYYWIALHSRVNRTEDNMERLTAAFDRRDEEHAAREDAIMDSFEEELRDADKGRLTFDMSPKAKE